MNERKLTERLKGQTAIARKVYDALPLSSGALTTSYIIRALTEAGTQISRQALDGILDDLRSDGLVNVRDGAWFRVFFVKHESLPAPPVIAPAALTLKASKAPPAPPAPPALPLDAFAELSAKAQDLSRQLTGLAEAIAAAALASEQMREQADRDTAQLRQLRALLRDAVA